MVPLSDIIGHETPRALLGRAMAEGRLPHALLLCGPPAVGKRTTALALAAALNCRNPRPFQGGGQDACGACGSCLKAAAGTHPDISYVTLEKTVIPIDSVRKMREEAAFAPFEGRWRLFVIDPADRLSIEAQNAMLKTLEEPARHTVIMLVTSRPMQLLPTTRSRCQMILFGSMPLEAAAAALAARGGMKPEDARRAARLAEGRIGAALQMDLADRDERTGAMLELLERLCADVPRAHVLADAEMFGSETAELAQSLEEISFLLRDLLILCAGGPAGMLMHEQHADRLAALVPRCAPRIHAMTRRVRAAISDLDANVNKRVLIETMLFDLADSREVLHS